MLFIRSDAASENRVEMATSPKQESLRAAIDYIPSWIELQLRASGQPGCVIAIALKDRILLEQAFGIADLSTGEKLTPRHRFRVASHSKSFTAAGVMKLREQGKLKLDDAIGDYVAGLNRKIARSTIGQILSHSAGVTRDGRGISQFDGRRPYLIAGELLADLAANPIIEANSQFKYSNHGFALLGLLIEAITRAPYAAWIKREVVDAAGLAETTPDMPIPKGTPFARGHSTKLLLGERMSFPGDYSENAIAPAGGFVATASDLCRYFAQLAPGAKRSVLSVSSRREMTRRHWRNAHAADEGYYGLGIISGSLGGWDWFGHSGGLPGYISRTAVLPEQELTISVLTNASNGWAGPWVDGSIHILREFARRGPPTRRVRDWTGRWWGAAAPGDYIPLGNRVIIADPLAWNPFLNAAEIEVTGRDKGRVSLDNGYGNVGEPVSLRRGKGRKVVAITFAGYELLPEKKVAAEMRGRYRVIGTDAPSLSKKRRRRAKPTLPAGHRD
jgi:CubicO group peptidase (beta-lactamase class C family)